MMDDVLCYTEMLLFVLPEQEHGGLGETNSPRSRDTGVAQSLWCLGYTLDDRS